VSGISENIKSPKMCSKIVWNRTFTSGVQKMRCSTIRR